MRTSLLMVVAAARALAQVGGAQAGVTSDCSIDGSVTTAVTGEPVPRALVALMNPAGASSTKSDSTGRWSFATAACGQTQVMATRPGFLGNGAGLRPGTNFKAIVLAGGSALHDVRIELTPQTVVAGKVVDGAGDPIMNAHVTALASRVVEGRRSFQPAGTGNTNDLGEYRIAGLAGSRYIVCANWQANGPGARDTLEERCYPGPAEAGVASAMELGAGRVAQVDFSLERLAQAAAAHVKGTIAGLPKNQSMSLSLAKRNVAGNMVSVAYQSAVRPDGAFDISGVAPGSYWVVCDHYEAGQRLTARVPVDVGGADVEGVTVQLEPGFSVIGTVRYESKTASALTNPQVNFSLRASDPVWGGGRFQWNADHTGFSVDQLTPGSYRLEGFSRTGFYVKSATLGGWDISREDIPIAQGAGPIDVVLSDDGGTIDATVVDSSGRPAEAWVMLLQEGARPINVRTADGHVKAANIAPGEYTAMAWDDWQNVEYADPEWMRRNASGVRVTVEAGQTAPVKLTQVAAPPQ